MTPAVRADDDDLAVNEDDLPIPDSGMGQTCPYCGKALTRYLPDHLRGDIDGEDGCPEADGVDFDAPDVPGRRGGSR